MKENGLKASLMDMDLSINLEALFTKDIGTKTFKMDLGLNTLEMAQYMKANLKTELNKAKVS